MNSTITSSFLQRIPVVDNKQITKPRQGSPEASGELQGSCPPLLNHQYILRQMHRLARSQPLTAETVAAILRYGAPVGRQLDYHASLPRCMVRLRQLIRTAEARDTSLPTGTVVMASRLTASSGRFDRHWHAPQGGLWLALAWADTFVAATRRLLPLAVGSACCEAIREAGVTAAIRWINDIHFRGCKLGGILCETLTTPAQEQYHLIGVGLNVNNRFFPASLQDNAISMYQILGRPLRLDDFGAQLLAWIGWYIGMLTWAEQRTLSGDGNGYAVFLEQYRALCDTVGKKIVYGFDLEKEKGGHGTAVAIDDTGQLLIRLTSGTTVTADAGEIRYQTLP